MVCAAVVNPTTDQLVLSTAQGYYTMDLVAGTFTALPFTTAPSPSPNFTLNPVAAAPYILSASPKAGELQILDLNTHGLSTVSSGLSVPGATAIDLITNYAAVVDADTNSEFWGIW